MLRGVSDKCQRRGAAGSAPTAYAPPTASPSVAPTSTRKRNSQGHSLVHKPGPNIQALFPPLVPLPPLPPPKAPISPAKAPISPPKTPLPPSRAPIVTAVAPPPVIIRNEARSEVQQLVCWAQSFPNLWEILVGIYFQESGRLPRQVAGDDVRGHQLLRGAWEISTRKLDMLANDPSSVAFWYLPDGPDGEKITTVAAWVCARGQLGFEEAIRQWTEQMGTFSSVSWLASVLYKGVWTIDPAFSPDWLVMAGIKRMSPSPEKDALLARAASESPLFFAQCMTDENCG